MVNVDFPQWLRRFAWQQGMDVTHTVAKVEFEREEIPYAELRGAKEGWQLTGRIIYTIKDNDQEFVITVDRVRGVTNGS